MGCGTQSAQVSLGSPDAQCAQETLGFRVVNAHKVARTNSWDSRCMSFSRKTRFGTQDAQVSRTCLCCATALVDFQAPARLEV